MKEPHEQTAKSSIGLKICGLTVRYYKPRSTLLVTMPFCSWKSYLSSESSLSPISYAHMILMATEKLLSIFCSPYFSLPSLTNKRLHT